MDQQDLDKLKEEHAKTSSYKSQAKYSFDEGFKKALKLVVTKDKECEHPIEVVLYVRKLARELIKE